MFVQDGVLAPALAAADYSSSTFFEAEKATVFARGWHLVATRQQLAALGAYVSLDIAGLPILVRNEGGELCAFVNVCAHRQSTLERPGCGVRDALRCQYHGWEYDSSGRVSKLPDGRSFKGLKTANLRLRTLRVATLGPLVYVSLHEDDPDLREWLGDLGEELRQFYERPLRPLLVQVTEHDVNWKVIVENAVESYHVPMVHPTTFKYYREPELHDHRLDDTFTRYADLEPWSTSRSGRVLDAIARLLLKQRGGRRYVHAHRFPNQLYYFGDLYCDVSVVTPIGPSRSRHTAFGFLADDLRAASLLRPLQRLFGLAVRTQGRRLFAEDAGAWRAVQAGVSHATRTGVLSAREERVWAFQNWLVASMR